MSALLPLVPKILHPSIRSSRYYAENSQALVIQADDSRKQSQNLNACFDKLTSMIAEAGRAAVPGETSPEQKKKVQKLCVDTEKTTEVIKRRLWLIDITDRKPRMRQGYG